MKDKTKSAFQEWQVKTEYLIYCLSEEMENELLKNNTNMLRAHMINIQILEKTKDVVSDWMEKGEGNGNQ